MAGRNLANNQYKSNVPEETNLHLLITAAADVEANGYVVTDGGKHVSGVTRSAEGVMVIALRNRYAKFINAHVLTSLADAVVLFSAEQVANATPTVTLIHSVAAANADPDGATIRVTLVLQNSGLGVL
jgi:hypothetical protein